MPPAKKPGVANLSVEELIDQFDAIPEMMSTLKANTASPRRYSCTSLCPGSISPVTPPHPFFTSF